MAVENIDDSATLKKVKSLLNLRNTILNSRSGRIEVSQTATERVREARSGEEEGIQKLRGTVERFSGRHSAFHERSHCSFHQ